MRFLAAVAALSLVACATAQTETRPPGASLDSVLAEVQGALQKSQDILAASSLPKLETVELRLHTQAARDATGKVTILFVTFGGGAGASASQELVLQLRPPKPKDVSGRGLRPEAAAPTPADSIVELIQAAAEAVNKAESGTPPLEAKSLILDLAFTVTQSVGGGLQFSVGVVSADAGGTVKNSAEQRIKITFGR
jgi:hypothetical protein